MMFRDYGFRMKRIDHILLVSAVIIIRMGDDHSIQFSYAFCLQDGFNRSPLGWFSGIDQNI